MMLPIETEFDRLLKAVSKNETEKNKRLVNQIQKIRLKLSYLRALLNLRPVTSLAGAKA